MAEHTPPERDRVVDLLRSTSLAVVVLGHLLMAVVIWRAGTPRVENLLGALPAAQLVTWILQVMPLFFLAGACSNAISWERARSRGIGWSTWFYNRLTRLVRPLIAYLGVWIMMVISAGHFLQPKLLAPLAALSTQLLWFLGVYVVVIALTPWLVGNAARAPWRAPAMMLAVSAGIDAMRFGTGVELFGLASFVVVWAMAAQLGLAIRRARPSRFALAAIVVGGLAINGLLVTAGPYPVSLVGLPGAGISNMSPPTVVLAVHCWILTALAGLLWSRLDRLTRHPAVWNATVMLGGISMTLYLWHLTALVGVVAVEHALGWNRSLALGSGWFWMETALHMLATLCVAWILVSLFAPLEHRKISWLEAPRPGPASTALGVLSVVPCALGFLVLAATGLAGVPFGRVTSYDRFPLTPGLGLSLLAVGVWLARSVAGQAPRLAVEPT